MSKAKTLASTVSTGGPLADGVITAADIGGLALPEGGDIVGTTSTQTLTNKTIDGATNTLSNVNLASQVTGTLPVANGGTGAASLTANNVLLGNGTSALQVVAPGTAGNILTSNGSTWTSTAPAPSASGLTLLSTVNVSPNSSTVNIENGIDSTYEYYVIQFDNVTLTNNGWHSYIGIRLKLNGSYQTSNYKHANAFTTSSSASISSFNSTGNIGIPLGVNSLQASSSFYNKSSGQVWFYNPTLANSVKTVNYICSNVILTDTRSEFISGSGFCSSTYATLSGVQFFPLERPTNALFNTGTFKLYGFAK